MVKVFLEKVIIIGMFNVVLVFFLKVLVFLNRLILFVIWFLKYFLNYCLYWRDNISKNIGLVYVMLL